MTRAVDCPNCNQKIGLADPPEVQENNTLRQEIERLESIPKIPSFIPNFQCKDDTCRQSHQNSRYSRTPKGKCTNCDQFSSTSKGVCSWCESTDFDEVSKDELRDLGIRLPDEY